MVVGKPQKFFTPFFSTCLQCGECTSICPVSQSDHTFNPRRIIALYQSGKYRNEGEAWLCVDCKLCAEVCPQRLPIDQLMASMKSDLYSRSEGPGYRHAAAFTDIVTKNGVLNEKALMMKLLNGSSVKDFSIYLKVFLKKKLYKK